MKTEMIGRMENNEDNQIGEEVDFDSILSNLNPTFDSIEIELYIINDMKITFERCWREINFGEVACSRYIEHCANQHNQSKIDQSFWSYVVLQIRYIQAWDSKNRKKKF